MTNPAGPKSGATSPIGKIFDLTGQRDRAIQEYRQALQTNDNTAGAMNEARHWIQTPYKRPDTDQ